ncbi:hypothetical protein POTOM_039982 [Populus tomentosa]|uniref:Cwf19-like C-terminal domain-containing protein n=1 Tax=Populus tomentosa TaxID=118781 RepID=A0A8X7YVP1_POPTO|nr:hypothetical protein POTOM_039982 [Populus tomentosa]
MIVIIRKLARLLEGCICPPSSDLSSKVHGTLSRRKRKSQNMSPKDAALVSAAASTVNKFADDGSFMSKILVKQNEDAGGSAGSYSNQEENVESHVDMLFKVFLREARRMKMLIGILLNLQAGYEYDFEDDPRSKSHKKGRDSGHKVSEKNDLAKRILTHQERCHCCISPMQHDSAARNGDNNVREEIRNFKKCLLMMFSKQEKDLVFLETVISLSKQRRHFHVIDDKKNFKSSLGDVMGGMLHLPEEDMYRRQRHGISMEAQKLAVANPRDWELFSGKLLLDSLTLSELL